MSEIYCTISTPQFKDSKVFKYHTQRGVFNKDTLLFTPTEFKNGNHIVQFSSVKEFETIAKP